MLMKKILFFYNIIKSKYPAAPRFGTILFCQLDDLSGLESEGSYFEEIKNAFKLSGVFSQKVNVLTKHDKYAITS